MPPATLVRGALPVSLRDDDVLLGSPGVFQTPMISTGTGSGLLPENTVQATRLHPGLQRVFGKDPTGPALGGIGHIRTTPSSRAGEQTAKQQQEEHDNNLEAGRRFRDTAVCARMISIIPQMRRATALIMRLHADAFCRREERPKW